MVIDVSAKMVLWEGCVKSVGIAVLLQRMTICNNNNNVYDDDCLMPTCFLVLLHMFSLDHLLTERV